MNNTAVMGGAGEAPRYYLASGNELHHDIPQIDTFKIEMAEGVNKALQQSPISACQPVPNMTSSQRHTLKQLRTNSDDHLVYGVADKESVFVQMTVSQMQCIIDQSLSGIMYAIREDFNLDQISVTGIQLFKRAVDRDVIDKTLFQWATQLMNHKARVAKLIMRWKTHKGIHRFSERPVKGRVIISPAQYPTLHAAQLIQDTLRGPAAKVSGRVENTKEAVRIIESTPVGGKPIMSIADVKDFFPTANRTSCRATSQRVWSATHSAPQCAFLAEVEQYVSDNIYFSDDRGRIHHMVDGYGIGVSYSNEITTLEFAEREAWMKAELDSAGIPQPTIYLRQVDDILIVYDGTMEQFKQLQGIMDRMDCQRILEWEVSYHSIDWCDITVYSGLRHRTQQILDIQLYQKPTDRGLYLPRDSHHPLATFSSILNGEAQRIIANCSDKSSFLQVLHCKYRQFLARGYKPTELQEHLIQKYQYEDRHRIIAPTGRANEQVLALVVPYTARAKQLQLQGQLRQFYDWAMSDPVLRERLRNTRWVAAFQRTSNLYNVVKPWTVEK